MEICVTKKANTLIMVTIMSVSFQAIVFAATVPGSKSAPATSGGFSLTPSTGGYLFAGSEQLKPVQYYGIKIGYDIIGKTFIESMGIEGSLDYLSTTSKTDSSGATGYLFRLDAIYPLLVKGKWIPAVVVGAGGIDIKTVSKTNITPLFNYGLGLKYFITDYLAIRADARHIILYNDASTRNNFDVGVGIGYYFGKGSKKKTESTPVIKKEEIKSDKGEKNAAESTTNTAPVIPVLDYNALPSDGKVNVEKNPASQGQTPIIPTSPATKSP
jgi:OOP family OmpA-OmpF porin